MTRQQIIKIMKGDFIPDLEEFLNFQPRNDVAVKMKDCALFDKDIIRLIGDTLDLKTEEIVDISLDEYPDIDALQVKFKGGVRLTLVRHSGTLDSGFLRVLIKFDKHELINIEGDLLATLADIRGIDYVGYSPSNYEIKFVVWCYGCTINLDNEEDIDEEECDQG